MFNFYKAFELLTRGFNHATLTSYNHMAGEGLGDKLKQQVARNIINYQKEQKALIEQGINPAESGRIGVWTILGLGVTLALVSTFAIGVIIDPNGPFPNRNSTEKVEPNQDPDLQPQSIVHTVEHTLTIKESFTNDPGIIVSQNPDAAGNPKPFRVFGGRYDGELAIEVFKNGIDYCLPFNDGSMICTAAGQSRSNYFYVPSMGEKIFNIQLPDMSNAQFVETANSKLMVTIDNSGEQSRFNLLDVETGRSAGTLDYSNISNLKRCVSFNVDKMPGGYAITCVALDDQGYKYAVVIQNVGGNQTSRAFKISPNEGEVEDSVSALIRQSPFRYTAVTRSEDGVLTFREYPTNGLGVVVDPNGRSSQATIVPNEYRPSGSRRFDTIAASTSTKFSVQALQTDGSVTLRIARVQRTPDGRLVPQNFLINNRINELKVNFRDLVVKELSDGRLLMMGINPQNAQEQGGSLVVMVFNPNLVEAGVQLYTIFGQNTGEWVNDIDPDYTNNQLQVRLRQDLNPGAGAPYKVDLIPFEDLIPQR